MISPPNRTARPHRILVVDDDASVKLVFDDVLDSDRFELRGALNAAEGLHQLGLWQPELVVLAHELSDRSGLEVLRAITERDRHLPVLVLTATPSADTAIRAMKLGAFDYTAKPVPRDRLAEQVERAVESRRLLRTPVVLQETESRAEPDSLVGRCSAMQRVFKAVGRLAAHDVPCLIQGEPGTGKKLVARMIHAHGRRADRPLRTLRCRDHDPDGIHRELFGNGHEGETGLLAACRGGTLVVEEITALPMAVQSSLLTQMRHRTGQVRSDRSALDPDGVALIFTTAEASGGCIGDRRVRSDLFYELSGHVVTLPPLRRRGDDVRLLVEHHVQRLLSIRRIHPDAAVRVSEPAMELLTAYRWPGNVTELQSVVRAALMEGRGAVLATECLRSALGHPRGAAGSASAVFPATANLPPNGARPDSGRRAPPVASPPTVDPAAQLSDTACWQRLVAAHAEAGDSALYGQAIERLERGLLSATLDATEGNLAQAARILGMTRVSLRKKIQKLELVIPGRDPAD